MKVLRLKSHHFYTKLRCQKPMLRQIEWAVQNRPIAKNGVFPVTTFFFENVIKSWFNVPTTRMFIFIHFTSPKASFDSVFSLRVFLKETFTLKQSEVTFFLSSTITILFSFSPDHLEMGAVIGRKLNYLTNIDERFIKLHRKTHSLVRWLLPVYLLTISGHC